MTDLATYTQGNSSAPIVRPALCAGERTPDVLVQGKSVVSGWMRMVGRIDVIGRADVMDIETGECYVVRRNGRGDYIRAS